MPEPTTEPDATDARELRVPPWSNSRTKAWSTHRATVLVEGVGRVGPDVTGAAGTVILLGRRRCRAKATTLVPAGELARVGVHTYHHHAAEFTRAAADPASLSVRAASAGSR